MKICFLGAGALGSALGGVLAEAGNEVWLSDRSRAHVDAINARGLNLREDGVERMVAARARTSAEGIGPADLVIVLGKSFQTRAAVRGPGALGGPDPGVSPRHNGRGPGGIPAAAPGRGAGEGGTHNG